MWDGVTHWSEYINYAPVTMGPNALPVPKLSDGHVGQVHYFTLGGAAHFSRGDHTQNMLLAAKYILVESRVSFSLYWVPFEKYSVSHAVKTKRKVFHTFYEATTAAGDIYFDTNVQILKKEKVGLAGRIGYKFPTSNMQGAARFTNAPGYYVDLSGYLNLHDRNKADWKIISMLGFYAWQTNQDEQFQNDAILFGGGLRCTGKVWEHELHIRGYFGYLKIGDQPVVGQLRTSYSRGRIRLAGQIEYGLTDYPFTSSSLMLTYLFSRS